MLYQYYLNNLRKTRQKNLLLLINLLKNTATAQDIIEWSYSYDVCASDLESIKHELSCENMQLLADDLIINIAISMYSTKLSQSITIKDIELFSGKLKLINNNILNYNKEFNYFNYRMFNIVGTLVDLEKMIIKFHEKFIKIKSLEQFNIIINEHARIIYQKAAELLLTLDYQQYNDLQLSIHRFKRHITTIIASINYQEGKVMHNRSNYFLGHQPGHYLSQEVQCDCRLNSLFLLFKKVFGSNASKAELYRNSSSDSSFSGSETVGSSVDSNGKVYASNSTSDGLSSDSSSLSSNNGRNNRCYRFS